MVSLKLQNKGFGKKRRCNEYNNFRIHKNAENWPANGQKYRFEKIFLNRLKGKPLKFLFKLKKKNPEVMFLGPGKGGTISEFLDFTSILKLNPVVDVFSLTKNLNKDVLSKVRSDYSCGVPFENLNVKNSKYKFLENKYDLVIGSMSVGVHTNYPINALFTSALMLRVGGKSYIQISNKAVFDKLFRNKTIDWLNPNFNFSELDIKKQLFIVKEIFNRMVKSYNPKMDFSFNIISNSGVVSYAKTSFIEIERIK